MNIAMELLADELVTAGITVNYRYVCDQPAHAAGPCSIRHYLYDAGTATAWEAVADGRIILTVSGRREHRIDIVDLRPTQAQGAAIAARLAAAA
ncbi:hypothetical protein ACFU99_19780 [Streptomyces sp. NPDC057654]|uniref:hypothetical protein n=1 Tax=Streptomyces sp. NPDC057654 TaxID=3346196 RepID=UPI0036912029